MSLTTVPSVSQALVTGSTIPRGAAAATTIAVPALSDVPDHLNGPPSWHQAVYIGKGYPFYRPNFILIAAVLWLVTLCMVSIWATILLRRSKRQNQGVSIVQELLTWKKGYWPAILCMFITSGFAIIDDGVRIGAKYVQQRYFMVQLLFNSFDYLAQIFLLFTFYSLLVQLMRWSSLRSKGLRSKYFWKFIMVRLGVCISLGIITVVLEGISIAYLTNHVFSLNTISTEGLGVAAFYVYLVFGLLYWLAAMELLIVSGHMVTVQRKHRLGKQKVYVTNLFVIALPFFVAASVRILGVFISIPPLAMYKTSDNYHTYVYPSIVICAVLGPLGYVSALGGIAAVAQNLDSSFKYDGGRLDQGERLDSIDIVLMDRDPQAAHDPPAR